jgi:hypothetical protein
MQETLHYISKQIILSYIMRESRFLIFDATKLISFSSSPISERGASFLCVRNDEFTGSQFE